MNKIDLIALDLDGTPAGPVWPGHPGVQGRHRPGPGLRGGGVFGHRPGRPRGRLFRPGGRLRRAGRPPWGGAVMCDARTGAHLRRWDLPRETGRRALELCLNREIVLMIFAGEAIVLDPYSKKLLMKHYPFPCFPRQRRGDGGPHCLSGGARPPPDQAPRGRGPGQLPPQRARRPGGGVHSPPPATGDFELVPAKVGKGRTLALMSLLRGVPLERCAAVGDSPQRPVHAGGGGNPHRHGQRQFPGEGGRPACGGGQRPRRRGRGHPVVFSAERRNVETLIKKESRRRCPDIFWHLRLYSSTFTIFMAASSRRLINSLRDLVVCDESLSKRSSISFLHSHRYNFITIIASTGGFLFNLDFFFHAATSFVVLVHLDSIHFTGAVHQQRHPLFIFIIMLF